MKSLACVVLCVVSVFGLFSTLLAQRKYDLKSGVITFENSMTILGKASPQKLILYFDEYGARERKEVYEGNVLMEAYLCNGETLYNVIFEEKTAYDAGPSTQGTEPKFDPKPDSAKGVTAKKLPPMTIAGRRCEAYELTDKHGKTILAGWNHITLFADTDEDGIHSVSKAVKIVENEQIPRAMFAAPHGYVVMSKKVQGKQ